MDDATEIGNAAYNLALCQILLGQLDQAESLAGRGQGRVPTHRKQSH